VAPLAAAPPTTRELNDLVSRQVQLQAMGQSTQYFDGKEATIQQRISHLKQGDAEGTTPGGLKMIFIQEHESRYSISNFQASNLPAFAEASVEYSRKASAILTASSNTGDSTTSGD